MKKLLAILAVLFAGTFAAQATDMGDDFHDHYNPATSNLSAYNRDLNSMVGTVDFHLGKGATFPGFNVGANVSVFKPSSKNDISSDSYTVLPFISAETRIPVVNVGLVARGTDFNGFSSIGGGLTYQMDVIEIIHLSFGAFYDHGRTEWYGQDHYSASAIASMGILFFTPYLGVGYDYGKLETRGYAYNRSTSDSAVRGMVGLDIHPFPLLSGFVGYTVSKDSHGFTVGLGLSL